MEPTELNWNPKHHQYFRDRYNRSLEEPIELIFRQTISSRVRARLRNGKKKQKQYDLLIGDGKTACIRPDFHKRGRVYRMPCKHLWVLKRDIKPHKEKIITGSFDYI
ncbi:MAG: hypothetical protein KAU03_01505 [Candidatus Altiarchaeales archaeon]|nr:hypothetical protein [Candidatus Altiarchaeales archaeon]